MIYNRMLPEDLQDKKSVFIKTSRKMFIRGSCARIRCESCIGFQDYNGISCSSSGFTTFGSDYFREILYQWLVLNEAENGI